MNMATGRTAVIKKSTWITIPLISTIESDFYSSSISKKTVLLLFIQMKYMNGLIFLLASFGLFATLGFVRDNSKNSLFDPCNTFKIAKDDLSVFVTGKQVNLSVIFPQIIKTVWILPNTSYPNSGCLL